MILPGNRQAVLDALRGVPQGMWNAGKALGQTAVDTIADPYGAGRTTGQAVQGATKYARETPLPQMGRDAAGAAQGLFDRATASPEAAGEFVGENINPFGLAKKVALLGTAGKMLHDLSNTRGGGMSFAGPMPDGSPVPQAAAPPVRPPTRPPVAAGAPTGEPQARPQGDALKLHVPLSGLRRGAMPEWAKPPSMTPEEIAKTRPTQGSSGTIRRGKRIGDVIDETKHGKSVPARASNAELKAANVEYHVPPITRTYDTSRYTDYHMKQMERAREQMYKKKAMREAGLWPELPDREPVRAPPGSKRKWATPEDSRIAQSKAIRANFERKNRMYLEREAAMKELRKSKEK